MSARRAADMKHLSRVRLAGETLPPICVRMLFAVHKLCAGGRCCTHREICHEMGITSATAVVMYTKKLADAGLIAMGESVTGIRQARAIRPTCRVEIYRRETP